VPQLIPTELWPNLTVKQVSKPQENSRKTDKLSILNQKRKNARFCVPNSFKEHFNSHEGLIWIVMGGKGLQSIQFAAEAFTVSSLWIEVANASTSVSGRMAISASFKIR
jgi:hypothetical protein